MRVTSLKVAQVYGKGLTVAESRAQLATARQQRK
jgi:hypothetical protein